MIKARRAILGGRMAPRLTMNSGTFMNLSIYRRRETPPSSIYTTRTSGGTRKWKEDLYPYARAMSVEAKVGFMQWILSDICIQQMNYSYSDL